jgi:heme/copper-type cytochrome/quinol oxidase subunit 2
MYNFLVKNGQLVAFLLGVVITLIFLISVFSGIGEFNMLSEEEQDATTIFDFGLKATVVLIIITAASMLLFGIYQVATNFRSSLKGIIGLVVLIIVFFVTYSAASGEATGAVAEAADKAGGLTAGNLKFISGSITTAIILVALAAASFVLSEIRNIFK